MLDKLVCLVKGLGFIGLLFYCFITLVVVCALVDRWIYAHTKSISHQNLQGYVLIALSLLACFIVAHILLKQMDDNM